MYHFKHCNYIAASQGFVHVPAMDTSSMGRCVFFLILALVFDVVGLILFFLGIFAPWSFWDFFVLSGPLLIFLSLVFWIFWYLGTFNSIVPSKLIIKLEALGLNPALCNWVLDGPPPGGEGRKQYLHFADPQHWGPTRVRAQPPPVLPVHPRLCGHARLQLDHQVCRRHNSSGLDYQQ
uniref:Transmembrane protein 238 like n=1 Tax=Hucho hucho TaxID=62062 RepID=A0A4W5RQR4_9TELE